MIDRVAIRARPPGLPLMLQTWGKLLFMHWPVPEALLRPLIPGRLLLDTHDGQAFVGVTPFTLWGMRPPLLPSPPRLGASHELNVRTYVHLDGVPGVWFLSLDASNPLAVWLARLGFFLPYYRARMQLLERRDRLEYTSTRTHRDAPPAELRASWIVGEPLPPLEPGSLDYFLIERYCLYTARREKLFRSRIHHAPWPLRTATLQRFGSSMLQSHGLPDLGKPRLLHQQAEPFEVGIWPLREV